MQLSIFYALQQKRKDAASIDSLLMIALLYTDVKRFLKIFSIFLFLKGRRNARGVFLSSAHIYIIFILSIFILFLYYMVAQRDLPQ